MPTYATSFWGAPVSPLPYEMCQSHFHHIGILQNPVYSEFLSFSVGRPYDIVVLVLPHAYYSLFCHAGISALANGGSFPAGGVPRRHAFPLPSAFCCERRGRSNLTALGGELVEKGLCFSFGHSRVWVEKQAYGSKVSELAFGHPRCKAWTPSAFACQGVGV